MRKISEEVCVQLLSSFQEGISDIHIINDLICLCSGNKLLIYRFKNELKSELVEKLSLNTTSKINRILIKTQDLGRRGSTGYISEFYILDENNNISHWRDRELRKGIVEPFRTFVRPRKEQQVRDIIYFFWSTTDYLAILYENNQLDLLLVSDMYGTYVDLFEPSFNIKEVNYENDFALIGWEKWTEILLAQKNGHLFQLEPSRINHKGSPIYNFRKVTEKPFGQLRSINKIGKSLALQSQDKKLIIASKENEQKIYTSTKLFDLDEYYQSISYYGNYLLTVHSSGKICLWNVKNNSATCKELKFKLQVDELVTRIIIRNGVSFIITNKHNLYAASAEDFLTTSKVWIDKEKRWYLNEYPDEESKKTKDFKIGFLHASYKDLERVLGKAILAPNAEKVTVYWDLKNTEGQCVSVHNWKDTFPLSPVTVEEFLKRENQEWRISGDKEAIKELEELLRKMLKEVNEKET